MDSKPDRPTFTIIAAAAIVSVLAFFFGTGLHPHWWLVWLAPLPLLLLAPRLTTGQAFLVSLLTFAAADLNILHYLHGVLGIPFVATFFIDVLPGVFFALAVILFRRCVLRGRILLAAMAFPALWTSYEFLNAATSIHGTAGNLAYSQMNFLPILQIASLTGIWGISFCVFLFSATIAALLYVPGHANQKKWLACGAGLFFLAIFAFGAHRLHSASSAPQITVALIASDLPENMLPETQDDALRILRAYADQANALSAHHLQAIVIPEKIAVVLESYRPQVDSLFSDAASRTGATIVVGLVRRDANGLLLNEARIYSPNGGAPLSYEKHHMLPPFESRFVVGTTRTTIPQPSGLWGITICKDMDFPQLSRQYGQDGAGLFLTPAWDFDLDGWWHGRWAILRGVESGFSIARAPRHGILSVTDNRGRVLAELPTNAQPFAVLLAQVPVEHAATLYSRWGDWFAWLCVLSLPIIFLATRKSRA